MKFSISITSSTRVVRAGWSGLTCGIIGDAPLLGPLELLA